VNPPIEIPDMPASLSKEERKEWRRLAPELEALGLISRIDRGMFASWCRVCGLEEDLQRAWHAKVERYVADGLQYLEAVEKVAIDVTPSGYKQQSALAGMLRSLREEKAKLAAQFGLSPSARSRVVASNNGGQLGLPGVEDEVAAKLSRLRSI
jgi:P27 family predicted phage terminase small subunit